MIESVQVDGGAFNVREGNHALNLASIYGLRSHLDPFFTFTGDQRDADGHGGDESCERVRGSRWRARSATDFWDRPEDRKQAKVNGGQVWRAGEHTLTLFGTGYLRLLPTWRD